MSGSMSGTMRETRRGFPVPDDFAIARDGGPARAGRPQSSSHDAAAPTHQLSRGANKRAGRPLWQAVRLSERRIVGVGLGHV